MNALQKHPKHNVLCEKIQKRERGHREAQLAQLMKQKTMKKQKGASHLGILRNVIL